MPCPHCDSPATTKRQGPTSLGSRRFRCRACGRRFNERTGTPFNDLQYPTDIVLLAVLRRLRSTRSFRDVAELLLQRGFEVTHETIRAWEGPLRPAARGPAASDAARPGRRLLVSGRDLRAGRRALVRSRPRPRPRWRPPGLHAQRAPRHGRRAALPAAPGGRGRAQAAARHDRCPSALPPSDPRDPREEGPAPMQPGLAPPHRAKPPGDEAALRPPAGLRKIRVRRALLLGVRCAPARLPRAPATRPICPPGRAATDLRHTLAVTDGGDAGGITRAARGSA